MDLTLQEEVWELMSIKERREKILAFQAACKSQEDKEGIELPPTELFCNGVYAREIHIPAGVMLVGEIHLHDHINVVSKGVIRVATEDGVRTIEAPSTFISKAGTKRAGFVIEDTVWTTFHATTKTTSEEVWDECVTDNYTDADKQLEHNKCLSLQQP